MKNADGSTAGVIAIDIPLAVLTELLGQMELSQSARLFILSDDGTYMTNSDSSKVMKANYFAESSIGMSAAECFGSTENAIATFRNYYAFGRIGTTPWYVMVDGLVKDYTGPVLRLVYLVEILSVLFSIVASLADLRTIAKVRKSEQELGARLFEETQTLVVAAKENAATSQDQSAAVKEIVATMEDSNALSESIAQKIKDVSSVAEKTSSDVADGVASIEQNVSQLHAIFDANQQTIDGMKVLSDKIESIWDIVTLINNVADQAKIIAFNAELEASSAGEAGKSFRIVANEIRRLSDGIIEGTKEIKEKITEIQHSSDALIIASESGTEKINAGYENAKSLGDRFASIKDSAEITASSAGDITDIIQQQTSSSEQILIALKQISAGVENFTVATDNISASSEHIRKMSEDLNNTVKPSESQKQGKA